MWKTLVFDFAKGDLIKSHLVTETLYKQLREDLESRSGVVKLSENYPKPAFFEVFGGMCFVEMPKEVFNINGNVLEVPSNNVGALCGILESYQERTFKDGSKYYKIHGPYWCLVLTPEEKNLLQQQCNAICEQAEERASEFVEQWKRRFGNDAKGNDSLPN
jgi:hypothetical protein